MAKFNVHMGEYQVTTSPNMLQTIGIGSCVVVCLYDKQKKIGGLAHILLPSSKEGRGDVNKLRFADKAIHEMVKTMERKGCEKFTAKIAGGSSMFPGVGRIMIIGERNVESVKKVLKDMNIRIIGEDVGGTQGRSVWFDTVDGSVVVSHTKGETTQI